ncbi:hypothetical protein FRC11_007208, partial [Ceratobasidium sp. 423]
ARRNRQHAHTRIAHASPAPDTPEPEDAISVEEMDAQLLETARQESLREQMEALAAREFEVVYVDEDEEPRAPTPHPRSPSPLPVEQNEYGVATARSKGPPYPPPALDIAPAGCLPPSLAILRTPLPPPDLPSPSGPRFSPIPISSSSHTPEPPSTWWQPCFSNGPHPPPVPLTPEPSPPPQCASLPSPNSALPRPEPPRPHP